MYVYIYLPPTLMESKLRRPPSFLTPARRIGSMCPLAANTEAELQKLSRPPTPYVPLWMFTGEVEGIGMDVNQYSYGQPAVRSGSSMVHRGTTEAVKQL